MKICIIVHSKTGNTRRLASLTTDKLRTRGHLVDLIEIQTLHPVTLTKPGHKLNFEIINQPTIENYDLIMAGGPVWGFAISPVTLRCIMQISSFKGKIFIPFATMGFPFKWLGGNRALRQLNTIAQEKGAVIRSGIVVWGQGKNKENNTIQAAEMLSEQAGK